MCITYRIFIINSIIYLVSSHQVTQIITQMLRNINTTLDIG